MKFLKTSAWASISTAIGLITKLATNKVVAIFLGTSGMFILGQIRDFLNVANAVGHLGTINGTTKYVAEFNQDKAQQNKFLATAFKIHLIASIGIAIACILFSDKLSAFLFNTTAYSQALLFIAVSLVTVSLNSFLLAILNGLRQVKIYVLSTSIGAIITAGILIVMVYYFEVLGALYAIAINQIVVLVISVVIIIWFTPFQLNFYKLPFNRLAFKNLSKFSIMALVAPICLVAATLFVRNFINDEYGDNYAGSWEGMWRLSAIYLLFLTTTFKFYLLPTFATLEGKALRKEVFNTWKYVFPLIVVIALGVYLLRDFIITLLFSEEFMLIGILIGFHLLGDIVKINTWVLGNLLIAKARTKAFIFFQIEWATVFVIGTIICTKYFGFKGVAMAYFAACCIHFLLMNIYLRKTIWTTPSNQN